MKQGNKEISIKVPEKQLEKRLSAFLGVETSEEFLDMVKRADFPDGDEVVILTPDKVALILEQVEGEAVKNNKDTSVEGGSES